MAKTRQTTSLPEVIINIKRKRGRPTTQSKLTEELERRKTMFYDDNDTGITSFSEQ